jgi:hypothetical protein
MAFETPPMLVGAKVGLDRATYSNMSEARKAFWEQKIMPRQRRVRDSIAAQLLPLVDPGGRGRRKVSLRWDNSEVLALRESEESRWTRATEGLRAGGMTVNDWRREVGLPDVTGGDVFLVPSGVIATRDMQGVNESVTGNGAGSESVPPKSLPDRVEVKADDDRAKAERAHEGALKAYFEDRQADVLATIGGKAALVNRPRWDDDLTGRLYAVGLAATIAAGKAASDEFDPARVEGYQYARAKGIAADINDSLEAEALEALTAEDPRSAVEDLFKAWLTVNAARQALTMVTAAFGWGATEAGRQAAQSGRPTTKTWVTGSRPRETHAAMNGETVDIDELFSNGMDWPGDIAGGVDEVAGCNCSVTIEIGD